MDLKELLPIVAQVTLVLMVASVGLRAQWRDVVAVLGKWHRLWRAIIAVNIVVPLTAVLMCLLFPIQPAIKIGIVLIAVSPLAPLLTTKILRAGLDASRAVGLYVMLVLLAVLIVPASIALLSHYLPPDASISVSAVAKLVATSVLAPLSGGLLVATYLPRLASRIAAPVELAGHIVLALLAVPIILTQATQIIALFGNGTVVAMTVTVLAGIISGHLLGGPEPEGRSALALAAATRHPGIAAMIAAANFPQEKQLMLVVMLFVAVSVILSFAYLAWSKRRG